MKINRKNYMSSFIKINTKEGKEVNFEMNGPQKRLYTKIRELEKESRPVRIIVLKARQMGFSTFTSAFFTTDTVTNIGRKSVVVAHTSDSTKEIFDKYRSMVINLPEELTPATSNSNAQEIVFDTKDKKGIGSRIRCMTAGGEGIGRGSTIHNLHISEYAFWSGNKEEILTGLLQAVPRLPNTYVIIESTANGMDHFKTLWDLAVSGKSDFVPFFCAWHEMEEYRMKVPDNFEYDIKLNEEEVKKKYNLDDEQIMWRRWCINNNCHGSLEQFYQEYPSCVTGETRIGSNLGLIKIKDAIDIEEATYGKVKRYIKNPKNKIYKITTKDGYSLRGTYEHPIFLTTGECKDLGALVPGDKIELSKPMLAKDYYKVEWERLGVKHSITIDERWGKFLGYFMGDGSYSSSCLSIVCDAKDTDTIIEVKELIKDLFGLEAHERLVGSKNGGCEVRVSCVDLKPIFDKLGIIKRRDDGKIIRDVKVPEIIFRSPKSVVKEFIKALFECDGFQDKNIPRVVLFSKHKEFINDVQLLLLSLGVVSTNRSRKTRNSTGYEYIANELMMTGYRAEEYQRNIGFISARKNSRACKVKEPKKAKKNDYIDEIMSIEEDGFEDTYNLTIEDIHEFDANGIHTHNCPEEAFLSTGRSVFNKEMVIDRINEIKNIEPVKQGYFLYNKVLVDAYNVEITNIRWIDDKKGEIKIFKDVENGIPYVLGCDTAGDGSDYFAGHVIDNITGNQVAVYHRQKVDEDLFADQMYCLGKYYNEALIGIEANFSTVSIRKLVSLNYPTLYARETVDTMTNQIQKKYGFITTSKTRPVIIGGLVEVAREDIKKINDIDTLREMLDFIYNENNRAEAEVGKHDDLVMSLAITHYISSQQVNFKMENVVKDKGFIATFFNREEKEEGSYMEW